jgi:hypothetical protein
MAEDIKHIAPVPTDMYAKRSRIYPNIRIQNLGFFTFFAPAEGYIEKYVEEVIIFRHKKEPYYSMFAGGKDLKKNFEIGQEVLAGVLLGSVTDELNWRIGAVDNKSDWMDPDEWLKGNYQVWSQGVGPIKNKKKTDWGTIALYVGGAYLLLKGTGKDK